MTQIEVLREITMDPMQPHTNVLTFRRNEVGCTKYQITWHYISENSILHSYHHENFNLTKR